jgi:transcriptional regulator with XRE-family HTH domain
MQSTINTVELATRLRDKRCARGLSIRQAARDAGVSQATLSRVLRGNHVPDRENLVLLARWLDASIEEFTASRDQDEFLAAL